MSLPSNELLILSLGTWDESYALANTVIAQMTLDEKLGIIIGTGQLNAARKLHLVPHTPIGFYQKQCRSMCRRHIRDPTARNSLDMLSGRSSRSTPGEERYRFSDGDKCCFDI